VLASNTSGIAITAIAQGLPEPARRRLCGMHFFNPPRYMHLLEVIPAADSDPAMIAELIDFSDRVLGKGVVVCRDTPNFIGNRVGIAEMLLTFAATAAGGYTVEEVDLSSTAPSWVARAPAPTASATWSGSTSSATSSSNLQDVLSAILRPPTTTSCTTSCVVPPMIAKMLGRKRSATRPAAASIARRRQGPIQ
jgi:hypothetical protein